MYIDDCLAFFNHFKEMIKKVEHLSGLLNKAKGEHLIDLLNKAKREVNND